MSDGSSVGTLSDGRLALLLFTSFVFAIVVMIGVLPELAGLVLNLAVLGVAFLTADERNRSGGGWWMLLAAGALAALAGEGLNLLVETPGSVLALIGGVLVAAGSVIGFPIAD